MNNQIFGEIKRLEHLIGKLEPLALEADALQHVYSNHIILKTAGFVETCVTIIFREYATRNGNQELARFVGHHVGRLNSLNCEKIEKFADTIDPKFWARLIDVVPSANRESIDSVKAVRDKIAHGKNDGTGFSTAKKYFEGCKALVLELEKIVIP